MYLISKIQANNDYYNKDNIIEVVNLADDSCTEYKLEQFLTILAKQYKGKNIKDFLGYKFNDEITFYVHGTYDLELLKDLELTISFDTRNMGRKYINTTFEDMYIKKTVILQGDTRNVVVTADTAKVLERVKNIMYLYKPTYNQAVYLFKIGKISNSVVLDSITGRPSFRLHLINYLFIDTEELIDWEYFIKLPRTELLWSDWEKIRYNKYKEDYAYFMIGSKLYKLDKDIKAVSNNYFYSKGTYVDSQTGKEYIIYNKIPLQALEKRYNIPYFVQCKLTGDYGGTKTYDKRKMFKTGKG